MRIIARAMLRDFALQHLVVQSALGSWYQIVKRTVYRDPHELQQHFPNVSLLGDGIAVFNIGSCRLETHVRYDIGIVFIQSIDTHDEYDRRNKARNRK